MRSNVIEMEVGPQCECGCGEYLPVGSKRRYKNGHRQRVNMREAERIDAVLSQNEDFWQRDLPYNTEPIDPYDQPIPLIDYLPEDMTLADAAEITPDDPDGNIWDRIDKEKARETVQLPAGTRKDIEGKLAFMLTMTGNMVSIPDPVCGEALLKNTPQITKAVVPLLMQSPDVVKWFQKSSNIMLYINLLMALWPVITTVFSHHAFKSDETAPNPYNGQMNLGNQAYGVS